MQFTLTDLQNEIKENSNKLLTENIDLLETIQKVDDNCRLDEKVWQLVIDQGWLALDVTEEDGGLGFSNTDTAILSEVLGYYMPIIPIFSSGVVFKHILLNSKKEKKDELLPEIISGQKIGTFAVYENDKYEINENTISTQLTPTDSGFKLNGNKKYVMFGDVSDYIAVLAKIEDSFKFILLPTDAEGVEVKPTTSLDQTRPMCEVIMQEVELGQDSVLIDLGILDKATGFFSSPNKAFVSLVLINSWRWSPFLALIILSGLNSINREMYDASKVDGANFIQQFLFITFPNLKSVLFVLGLVGTLLSFNIFDIIWLITKGGPSSATTTLPLLIYETAFTKFRISHAATLSIITSFLLLLFSIIFIKSMAPKEDD